MLTPRRTKIVCTIGPASDTPKTLASLMDAGMNVVRLNFSHGSHAEHRQRFDRIRRIAKEKNLIITILQDLGSPKFRAALVADSLLLKPNDGLILTDRFVAPFNISSEWPIVSIAYSDWLAQMQIGDTIQLDGGTIELLVAQKNENAVFCRVIDGGILDFKKGTNLLHKSLDIDIITEKDRYDLKFGLEMGVDCIAISFKREPTDIKIVKNLMNEVDRTVPIFGKIEKYENLQKIDSIINEADGIIIARGELALETPPESVPMLQKMIIRKCNRAGKPVIISTQMLKSMVEETQPTRAEATDIANAVFDGTDAVMLSEETAIGKYPIQVVQVMDKILRTAEVELKPRDWLPTEMHQGKTTIAAAVSHAAVGIAQDLNVTAILTPTSFGGIAQMVARYRPRIPVIAFGHRLEAVRWLATVWGIYPIYIEDVYQNSDELIFRCKKEARASGLVNIGDTILITTGLPPSQVTPTNSIIVDIID